MRKILPACWLMGISFTYGQTSATFDANQIRTVISNVNSLFWDLNSQPVYYFPADSGTTTLFVANLWVTGKDVSTDSLKGFADRYHSGGSDSWPGPLTIDGNAYVSSVVSNDYDKVWKVTETMINDFIVEYNAGNVTNLSYPVPPDILTWPIHGPVGYSQQLSPFFDNNSDGFYDPYDGDYPIIKGTQMLRWIFNDNLGVHQENPGPPIQMEVHANFYGCQGLNSSDPLDRTTFLEYTLINRSSADYDSVYIGLNADADIGGSIDDYIRSNVAANSIQFYNADLYDNPYAGSAAYLGNPPVQSISLLEVSGVSTQPLMGGFMYYNNSGGPTGDPANMHDINNYLQSRWKDNSHLTFGGNGFGGILPAKYLYPGASDPTYIGTNGVATSFYWKEEDTDGGGMMNFAGDRRGIISTGPFNFPSNSEMTLTFALITTQDSTLSTESLLQKNIDEVTTITNAYIAQALPCQHQYIGVEKNEINQVAVFPNPASDMVIIQSSYPVTKIELMNANGSLIKTMYSTNQLLVSEVATGAYIAKIYFEDQNQMQVKKILIIR